MINEFNKIMKGFTMDVSRLTVADTRESITRLRENRKFLLLTQERKAAKAKAKGKPVEVSLDLLSQAGILIEEE
jgi:hypothetical protein